jgi:hypothetical protein
MASDGALLRVLMIPTFQRLNSHAFSTLFPDIQISSKNSESTRDINKR